MLIRDYFEKDRKISSMHQNVMYYLSQHNIGMHRHNLCIWQCKSHPSCQTAYPFQVRTILIAFPYNPSSSPETHNPLFNASRICDSVIKNKKKLKKNKILYFQNKLYVIDKLIHIQNILYLCSSDQLSSDYTCKSFWVSLKLKFYTFWKHGKCHSICMLLFI